MTDITKIVFISWNEMGVPVWLQCVIIFLVICFSLWFANKLVFSGDS